MTGAAAAEDLAEHLALSGNDWWVAVASRQDLTEAISIANTFSAQKSRVVRAQNGWFAVILGPFATTDLTTFQRDYAGPRLPPDAMLTRGTSYVETMWQPASGAPSPSVTGVSPDWTACANLAAADASILARTSIIDAGADTRENLGTAYYNRGGAYWNKGDWDASIADLNKAIQLNSPHLLKPITLAAKPTAQKGTLSARSRTLTSLSSSIRTMATHTTLAASLTKQRAIRRWRSMICASPHG